MDMGPRPPAQARFRGEVTRPQQLRDFPGPSGRLLAVTGFEVPWTIFFAPTATEADYADAAREVLDRTVTEALGEDPGVPVEKHLAQNRPAQALTDACAGATLLVVGSHGRGELPGMHLGSVAGYCVHHAPCPVLVFRGEHTGL
jgi:nucleotide-binding universal stress UspA family protein